MSLTHFRNSSNPSFPWPGEVNRAEYSDVTSDTYGRQRYCYPIFKKKTLFGDTVIFSGIQSDPLLSPTSLVSAPTPVFPQLVVSQRKWCARKNIYKCVKLHSQIASWMTITLRQRENLTGSNTSIWYHTTCHNYRTTTYLYSKVSQCGVADEQVNTLVLNISLCWKFDRTPQGRALVLRLWCYGIMLRRHWAKDQ